MTPPDDCPACAAARRLLGNEGRWACANGHSNEPRPLFYGYNRTATPADLARETDPRR